jgi:hypothetical protein
VQEEQDDEKVEFVILGASTNEHSQDRESMCSEMSEPSLKIHKNNKEHQSMTQVQIQELKNKFVSLKGMLTNKGRVLVEEGV